MLVLGSVPWEIIIFNHQFGDDFFYFFPIIEEANPGKCLVVAEFDMFEYIRTHTELAHRCTCFQASRECAKTTGLHCGERQRSELSERSCGEDSGSSSAC